MIKKLILINLIILTLLSCKKDEEETPIVIPPIGSSETFEFFKVGNRWEYFKFQIYQDGDTTHQTTDTAYFTDKVEGEENALYMHFHRSTSANFSTFIQKIEDGIYYHLDRSFYLPRGFQDPNINYREVFPTAGDSLLVSIINTNTIYQEFGLNIKCYTIKHLYLIDDYENDTWGENYFLVNNKIGLISKTQIVHNIVTTGDKVVMTTNLINYTVAND